MRDPRFDRGIIRIAGPGLAQETIDEAHRHGLVFAQSIPDSATLQETEEWRRRSAPAAVEAFDSAFFALVCASDETRGAWVSSLRALVVEHVNRYRTEHWFVTYCEEWQKQANPFRVWNRQFSLEIRGIHRAMQSDLLFFALYLLSQIDRHTWLEVLDAFPLPNFAYTALLSWNSVAYDRQLIDDLLGMAPVALSPNGDWLSPRRVVAFILVAKIVSHAGLLYHEVEQYERQQRLLESADEQPSARTAKYNELALLTNEELPNWMRSAFRIVLDRPDGKALLIGYLAHLCDAPEMGRTLDPWDARDCARRILAEELARESVIVDTVRMIWTRSGASEGEPSAKSAEPPSSIGHFNADEGEGARASSEHGGGFLYAAALITNAAESSGAEVVALWHFLEERLLARDSMIRYYYLSSYRYNGSQGFAGLLTRLPAPDVTLRDTYLKLEPQRRRAMYSYQYNQDYDCEEGSRFLIRVGLYCCAYSEPWDAMVRRHELFWWLYDVARRIWLTSPLPLLDEDRSLVALFFAYMPAIFGNSLADALPRALAPIRNDAWLVSMAGALLWRNGVEPAEVVRLFQNVGVQLPTALRDAYQWVSVTESGQRVESVASEFPPILRDFAAALNIVFDSVSPVPERASLRNEFMSTVPWGHALWQTLERDGFTNIRVHCLESQTWLLQTTAPETLRQRFGLSPDLRVLAVYGQLASRDVRLAVNEPADVGAVDPDLLVIACDHPDFAKRLASRIPGPFGQRIPWIPSPKKEFPPLVEMFREYAGKLDLFEYRDPVHGNGLVGRTQEIEELTTRLLRGEAVGVFGLRKVGKSSMMEAVAERIDPIGARRGMFRAYGMELPEHADPLALVVSFDAQGVGAKTLAVLVERLLKFLDERLALAGMHVDHRDIGSVDEDPLERFRRRLSLALERSPLPICFMIDEYDLLFVGYDGRGELPGIERLFAMLRAEANATRRVSLALVGRDPAFVDQPHLGGFTNPLLGWVHHQYLGPLRRDEADELLVRLGKRVGLEVGQQSLDLGWQWTGGHPLLHRQYGSALFELAHAPATRPCPIPTDPVCIDAIDVFPSRDAVQTINGEIRTLLGVRFPASAELLEALAAAPPDNAEAIVARHGGKHSRALQVLRQFGIVKLDDGRVWVPEIFRDEFGAYARSEAYEVAGE